MVGFFDLPKDMNMIIWQRVRFLKNRQVIQNIFGEQAKPRIFGNQQRVILIINNHKCLHITKWMDRDEQTCSCVRDEPPFAIVSSFKDSVSVKIVCGVVIYENRVLADKVIQNFHSGGFFSI